jgi:hypothetical protein
MDGIVMMSGTDHQEKLVVPVGGLEPPRLAATDFESVVYTNFTTPALITIIDRFRKPDLYTLH